MERYIGLDVHAASTTFAVVGESGKRLGTHVVETNGQAVVEQLTTIPGTRHVCLEEGTQSTWLYEILAPHAEEVVVVMVPESRGQKNDAKDAFDLAEQQPPRSTRRSISRRTRSTTSLPSSRRPGPARRSRALCRSGLGASSRLRIAKPVGLLLDVSQPGGRSEEHTSELQSRSD